MPIPTRKVKNGTVESFLDIDTSYSLFFHDPHFGSAFVVYIIGASVKQSDAVDRIDARVVFVGMAQNLSVRLAAVGTSTPKGAGGVTPVQTLPAL